MSLKAGESRTGAQLLLLALLACWDQPVRAEPAEPSAILEAGVAGAWGSERPAYGPSLAVEVTAIPEWLELEAGVSPLFSRGAHGVGRGFSVQETLDIVRQCRVHVRCRPVMVAYDRTWCGHRHGGRQRDVG